MQQKVLIVFLIVFLGVFKLDAQVPSQESVYKKEYDAKKMIQVMPSYSYITPNGDLQSRFGVISALGIALGYKTYNNLTFNGSYHTLFGNRVNETNMFDSLRGPSGELIDVNGNYSDIQYAARGANICLKAGKIFRIGQNANNGIWLQGGYSYLRHFVKFEYQRDILPQIDGDMSKGYDRLSAGGGFIGSIGYHHITANNTISYFINFDLGFHSTKSFRGFNYTTRMPETGKRADHFTAINFGIILPVKPKTVNQESLYK
jgi:hypothetical protein